MRACFSISLIEVATGRAEVVFDLLVYRQENPYAFHRAEPIGELSDQVVAKLALEPGEHAGPPAFRPGIDRMVPFHPLVHPPLVWVDRRAAGDAVRLIAEFTEIDAVGERPMVIFIQDSTRLQFVSSVTALKDDVRWWVDQVLASDDRSAVNTSDELSPLSRGEF